jgi:hypothetical protein
MREREREIDSFRAKEKQKHQRKLTNRKLTFFFGVFLGQGKRQRQRQRLAERANEKSWG